MSVCVATEYYRNQWTCIACLKRSGVTTSEQSYITRFLHHCYRVVPSEALLKQFSSIELITR
jgi:hypothetical protein